MLHGMHIGAGWHGGHHGRVHGAGAGDAHVSGGEVLRNGARRTTRLARVVGHSGCQAWMALRDAGMLLHGSRMGRESRADAGHHFSARGETARSRLATGDDDTRSESAKAEWEGGGGGGGGEKHKSGTEYGRRGRGVCLSHSKRCGEREESREKGFEGGRGAEEESRDDGGDSVDVTVEKRSGCNEVDNEAKKEEECRVRKSLMKAGTENGVRRAGIGACEDPRVDSRRVLGIVSIADKGKKKTKWAARN